LNKYISKSLVNTSYKIVCGFCILTTVVVSSHLYKNTSVSDDNYSDYTVPVLSEQVDLNSVITRFEELKDSYVLTIECETSNSDIDEIVELLDTYNVKASFFVTGIWAEKYKDDIRLIESKGHDICCHGFTHLKLSTIDNGRIKEELKRFRTVVSDCLDKNEWNGYNYFRAPYNENNKNIITNAGEQGYYIFNDEINALDWKNDISNDEVLNNIKNNLLPGDILTLHSGHTKSPTILAELLKFTQKSNLTAKSISEIMSE